MLSRLSTFQRVSLAQETRKRFVSELGQTGQDIASAVQECLLGLMNETASLREMQVRREAWNTYQRARAPWVQGTVAAWQQALISAASGAHASTAAAQRSIENLGFQLVGTDEVEDKILASRLVRGFVDQVSAPLDDLRVRIKMLEGLEGSEELSNDDILRPEVWSLALVEQWTVAGMPREAWVFVQDAVLRVLVSGIKKTYEAANQYLIKQGVLPTIELNDRVKRVAPVDVPGRRPSQSGTPTSTTGGGGFAQSGFSDPPDSGGNRHAGAAHQMNQRDGALGGRLGWGGDAPSSRGESQGGSARMASGGPGGPGNTPHHAPSSYGSASEETRMLTATTPLARARSRAQGVMGQLKRLLIGRIGSEAQNSVHQPASPGLASALAKRPSPDFGGSESGGTVLDDYSPAGVVQVANRLREQTTELKKKAETKNEKATIEIVALMFQAILQEDRIPPGIRVWFARLQMPVLRVALEEPDFFGTLDHPARQLIDRMGSCVMGFDASGINGGSLESEIKRVVQVIEQYPETGKRVYQLVYEEFQKFLEKFLTEKGSTQKVVSVAQQVEQKETLTIQYTIEMRNMLKDMPVRDEIREFLFKIWAEVLAVAAVRKGPQHIETLELKKSSTDLVWAASAKPNRSDRARVIADLPKLLQRLRAGMTLLGLPPSEQDAHIKTVSDTLADAFLSKTQAIPQAQIEAMAQRLAHLEDFVSEDGMGDLPLDADSIEIMLGIDASTIDVVANGGSKPTDAMLAWARELQLGAWFTLDHNGRVKQVQFAWRSDRKHLHLFASTDGHSYLIQAGRLAAYLQAGLLLPQEEETLTVRATRDALAKLEANPERLLE